jgi:3-oxosteroid 1-dehydrogenase
VNEQQWDVVTDCVIVGSGGGSMCAALAAVEAGHQALILEKTDAIGGSTAMSAGVLWLPNNPVSRRAGVPDSRDDALRYFGEVVESFPSSSPQRIEAFLDAIEPMVNFLEEHGIPFRHCEGYSDYYCDRPGGKARGRSIETELFDTTQLGPWQHRLRVSKRLPPLPLYAREVPAVSNSGSNAQSLWTIAKIARRAILAAARRQEVRGAGAALQGWMMLAAMNADIPIWESTPVTDLIRNDAGAVIGVAAQRRGRPIRIRARRGVLLDSGGFSHNEQMRRQYGRQPSSSAWTSANPGDTGEVLQAAIRHGAATDLMDEAWWIISSVLPDGTPMFMVYELQKPHGILVDGQGQRYVNEASSYMEVGKTMYERNATAPAIPSYWVMDSRHRRRYIWGMTPGGFTPREWLYSGYMIKADSIDELARKAGIDADGLVRTVERFNTYAARGEDPDFHKGERAYDRYYADPSRPHPCLGTIEKPPFYAVAAYPGDVGTCGGLLTDEHARVLAESGDPIRGLYATGNCTASVMGRTYPGAGASIGASFVFGWIAAQHMCGADAAQIPAPQIRDAANV